MATDGAAMVSGGGASFSHEENERLTRTGPETPMGKLFRRYWIPALFPDELSERKPQKRVRLLGEDLVMFRTPAGRYGLVGEFCSHRLASLYFGRVEPDGIRCLYHGWLYGIDGACLDQGNIAPQHQFKERIHHPGYAVAEHGGVLWAYMGPSGEVPPLPEFEWALVDDDLRLVDNVLLDCNYLQAMEGGIDPTHVMWLHSPMDLADAESASQQPTQQRLANRSGKRTPSAIQFFETPYGFYYGTRRELGDGRNLWRINQWLMPFHSMPPGGDIRGGRMFVPVDDTHCVRWDLNWYPTRVIKENSTEDDPIARNWDTNRSAGGRRQRGPARVGGFLPPTAEPYGDIRKVSNRDNDYNLDWDVHYSKMMGVRGVSLQDICIVENEGRGGLMDRTKENLCGGDISTVTARRRLLEAARALEENGQAPLGARDGSIYRVRGASIILPADADLVEGIKETTTVSG